MLNAIKSFIRDEEGAQIIEYALVVAVISVSIILMMKTTLGTNVFTGWLTRISNCLTGATACV